MLAERDTDSRQRHHSPTAGCLGLDQLQALACQSLECPANNNTTTIKIDVCPPKAEQFTPPQAEPHRDRVQRLLP